MNIILFGLSNVGKTTAGRILAERLGYSFYDLDDEVRKKYSMTQQEFIDTFWRRNERDKLRGQLIGEILENDGDKVIAVTPMSLGSSCRIHQRIYSIGSYSLTITIRSMKTLPNTERSTSHII